LRDPPPVNASSAAVAIRLNLGNGMKKQTKQCPEL